MTSNNMIYVVDDDPSMRKSLNRLLKANNFIVTTYEDPIEFVQQVEDKGPACALVDMKMPGLTGLEVQKKLMKAAITLPIIFITGHGTISMSVEAIRDGAVDFLEKPFEEEVLLNAIERALDKHSDRLIKKDDVDRYTKGVEKLTTREKEVLELIVKGFVNREIAELLSISEKTVKNHRANIMTKMNVDSLIELVQLNERYISK